MSGDDPTTGLTALRADTEAEHLLPPDTTMLDLLDNVLSKGVVIQGELMIGLAGVDLVYLGVTAILCSADRVMTRGPAETAR
jgi:hypothetical protein